MSEQARAHFLGIVERYLAAGSPERGGWSFDVAQMTDLHRELETAGLIQRAFGVPGGFAWRLTEIGVERGKQSA